MLFQQVLVNATISWALQTPAWQGESNQIDSGFCLVQAVGSVAARWRRRPAPALARHSIRLQPHHLNSNSLVAFRSVLGVEMCYIYCSKEKQKKIIIIEVWL